MLVGVLVKSYAYPPFLHFDILTHWCDCLPSIRWIVILGTSYSNKYLRCSRKHIIPPLVVLHIPKGRKCVFGNARSQCKNAIFFRISFSHLFQSLFCLTRICWAKSVRKMSDSLILLCIWLPSVYGLPYPLQIGWEGEWLSGLASELRHQCPVIAIPLHIITMTVVTWRCDNHRFLNYLTDHTPSSRAWKSNCSQLLIQCSLASHIPKQWYKQFLKEVNKSCQYSGLLSSSSSLPSHYHVIFSHLIGSWLSLSLSLTLLVSLINWKIPTSPVVPHPLLLYRHAVDGSTVDA